MTPKALSRTEDKRDIQSEICAVNIHDEYEGGIMDCIDKQIDYYKAQIKELNENK